MPIYVVSFVFKIDMLEPLKAPSSILVTFFKSIGFSSLKHFASSNALALIVVIFSPKFKFNDSSQELKFLSPRWVMLSKLIFSNLTFSNVLNPNSVNLSGKVMLFKLINLLLSEAFQILLFNWSIDSVNVKFENLLFFLLSP